ISGNMIPSRQLYVLGLEILRCSVRIECRDRDAFELVRANYAQMLIEKSASPDLAYKISQSSRGSGYRIRRRGREPLIAGDEADLLFLLEKDLTIELQKLRRDLYFVHAAGLARARRAVLLVAASGKGKSTTSWALLHHGFGYLSDELAPLDLDRLEVQPYAHALCLKGEPPGPYGLPAQTVRTRSTLHIPVQHLPHRAAMEATPLTAIFFLAYCPALKFPAVHPVSPAEAAARLFAQALNPLAHAEDGLPAAVTIAQRVPSFRLDSGDLRLTCALISQTLAAPAAA
ncbi:MAG: hypothetical protein ACREQW_18580, partial [Candidatus Binatia bacterium]